MAMNVTDMTDIEKLRRALEGTRELIRLHEEQLLPKYRQLEKGLEQRLKKAEETRHD